MVLLKAFFQTFCAAQYDSRTSYSVQFTNMVTWHCYVPPSDCAVQKYKTDSYILNDIFRYKQTLSGRVCYTVVKKGVVCVRVWVSAVSYVPDGSTHEYCTSTGGTDSEKEKEGNLLPKIYIPCLLSCTEPPPPLIKPLGKVSLLHLLLLHIFGSLAQDMATKSLGFFLPFSVRYLYGSCCYWWLGASIMFFLGVIRNHISSRQGA